MNAQTIKTPMQRTMTQPRDKLGRFIRYKAGVKRYTAADIKAAYMAALNNHGGYTLPSKKTEQYLKANGID